jgi:hypothetical protein
MRAAPVGLAWPDAPPRFIFKLACRSAALTHGHPAGQHPAGVLAVAVARLVQGDTLDAALDHARASLVAAPHHAQTLAAFDHARTLAASPVAPEAAIARLGAGWVGEEALAIAVYCALVARDYRHGVRLAVNHDGDSDSTGSLAGQLLGARDGDAAIPPEWRAGLELREDVTRVADDLYTCAHPAGADDATLARLDRDYPFEYQPAKLRAITAVPNPLRLCRKLMDMVGRLHALGYESLYLDSHMSPSGGYWRYDIGLIEDGRWPSQADWHDPAQRVHGSVSRSVLGDNVWCESGGSLDVYVEQFVAAFPALLAPARRPAPDYVAWYRAMLAASAPTGVLLFFEDYGPYYEHALFIDSDVKLPLPPGYCGHRPFAR